jgi:uncharacterized protein
MKTLCIYHGNCADGFTAAWVVRKALGSDVDFHPGVYQNPPPDVANRDVVMVDFSYKRPVIDAMSAQANSLLILDHHKTAEADLADIQPPFGPGWLRHLENIYQDMCEGCGGRPYALFDVTRSGAQLTWDFFFPSDPRPLLVDYTGDRDLWRFNLPLSREVNAYVFANEYTFKNWDSLHAQLRDHMDVQRIAEWGGAIEKKHHKDVAELVEVTRRQMKIGGYIVPVANIPYTLTSDAGHLMAQGEPFAVCYWDTPEGRVFSLRSTDAGMDVSEVAKRYGGGGHRNASGFRMPLGWEGE